MRLYTGVACFLLLFGSQEGVNGWPERTQLATGTVQATEETGVTGRLNAVLADLDGQIQAMHALSSSSTFPSLTKSDPELSTASSALALPPRLPAQPALGQSGIPVVPLPRPAPAAPAMPAVPAGAPVMPCRGAPGVLPCDPAAPAAVVSPNVPAVGCGAVAVGMLPCALPDVGQAVQSQALTAEVVNLSSEVNEIGEALKRARRARHSTLEQKVKSLESAMHGMQKRFKYLRARDGETRNKARLSSQNSEPSAAETAETTQHLTNLVNRLTAESNRYKRVLHTLSKHITGKITNLKSQTGAISSVVDQVTSADTEPRKQKIQQYVDTLSNATQKWAHLAHKIA